jgi:hypothetical protein
VRSGGTGKHNNLFHNNKPPLQSDTPRHSLPLYVQKFPYPVKVKIQQQHHAAECRVYHVIRRNTSAAETAGRGKVLLLLPTFPLMNIDNLLKWLYPSHGISGRHQNHITQNHLLPDESRSSMYTQLTGQEDQE